MKKLLIILLGKLIRLIEKPWTLLDLLKKRMTMMRIEIEDTTVNGTFNMMFLGYSISLGYKNHRNIIMRISSVGSQDNDPSVLVNGHFDSPLGSPGAGDCGSCVASMLEIARLTVDSGWVPPRPIIFLFNGAEELFMLIFYSRKQAVVLHSIPVAIYLFMPFLLRLANVGLSCSIATFYDFIKGMLVHATGIILAVLFPVICAILRLLVTGHSMNWFAHPFLAFMMFVPGSLVGLLIPRIVWRCFPLSQDVSVLKASREELADEARFWGAFGFYAVLTAAYLVAGLSGGFLTFSSSLFMLPAWICFCLSLKSFGRQSLRSIACYVVPLIPCLAYSVYFGGFIAQFLIEKMGMMGSLPPPHGYFVPDIVVAALTGVVTGWCVGPLIPVLGHWLARSAILQFLLQLTVIAMALSSRFFPYSIDAPKRVVFQHTVLTTDASHIVDTNYEFSVVDSNSLLFVFKHAPEVAKELHIGSELSFETANFSHQENWMAIYPVSFLFSRSLKFSAKSDEVLKEYRYFPHLSSYKPQTISGSGSRKVYLELSLGSLKEVWVAVLNITGPLSNWSLANNVLPAPERLNGGPPSYMCRLSGASNDNWTFWLEANSTEALRIEVAVLDQYLLESTKKLRGLFPDWVDVTAYSSFMSSYVF